MGKITMFHPPSGVTQDASKDAFDRVYREQGWELVDTPAPKPAPAPPSGPADGTIEQVIDWVRGGPPEIVPVDGWRDRAQEALEAEQAKGDKTRKRLVDRLEEILTQPEPEHPEG